MHSREINLELIRGGLALVVLLAHINQIFFAPYNNYFSGLFGILGAWAVLSFFAISGFLIRKSIIGNIRRNKEFNTVQYIKSRINRIYPPLIFSIILSVLLWWVAPIIFASNSRIFLPVEGRLARSQFEFDIADLFGSIFFLNGFFTKTFSLNGPLWSLAYEFWYYIIAGLLNSNKKKWISIPAGLGLLIMLTFYNKLFGLYATVWFFGLYYIEVGQIFKRIQQTVKLPKLTELFFLGSLLFFVGTMSLDLREQYLTPTTSISLIIYLINTVVGFYIVCKLIQWETHIFKAPKRAWYSYSYTLYIVHFPVLLFIFGCTQIILKDNILITGVVAAISGIFCIFISVQSGRFIEEFRLFR